jgi:hypothetical protein
MPDFARMIDEFQYSLIVMLAGVHWSLQKALIMAGYTVKVVNQWLIENAFAPIITQTNESVQVAVSVVFVVALLVLGITYLLAAFIRLEVVNPRSAIIWYAAGALFFAVGPSLYQGMNDFRLTIGQTMYLSVLDSLDASAGNAFNSLSLVESDDLDMGALCDQLDVYLPSAAGVGPVDGLDIAMAYLRAHAQDVMGYPQPLYSPGCGIYFMNPNPSTWTTSPEGSVVPMDWNLDGGYFNGDRSPVTWDALSDIDRDASVAMAGASQRRALTAWPVLLFGFAEQIVHLLITIAMGITFVSFAVAILFAFFKRTESIAQNMINQWIELIVQTVAIALVQALIMGFFLAGTAAGSAPAVIGISLICLVFILIALFSGVKAVWNSFNRLFNAMGQAAGGTIMSPGAAAAVTAGGAAAAVVGGTALMGTVASIGSNTLAGMSAMNQGATRAQAAGLTLGGFDALTGSARALTHIPGLRGTPLYDAAEQFVEGAAVRRVTGHLPFVGRSSALVGTMLLTDRDPERAEYDDYGRVVRRPMLVPAIGDALKSWSLPKEKRKHGLMEGDYDWQEDENGDLYPSFTPARRQRVGMFTPVALQPTTITDEGQPDLQRDRQRSDYAAEMNSEEMEKHISETMQSNRTSALVGDAGGNSRLDGVAARLEDSADALMRSALMLGQLRVTGSDNVASVMGDVLRLARADGGERNGIDHLGVGALMAQALGVTPDANRAPITDNLARFGLFADSAMRLGLSDTQAEAVVREVKESPAGRLGDERRQALIDGAHHEKGFSWDDAREEVAHLEAHAQRLPDEITAYGMVAVPAPTLSPQVLQAPTIHIKPQIDVSVEAPKGEDVENAIRSTAKLAGSGEVHGGGL